MIIDIRGYDPERNVNRVGDGFDFIADVETLLAVRDLYNQSQRDIGRLQVAVPGKFGDDDSMPRITAELRLAEVQATILRGWVAQLEDAVASYPVHIKAYARERFADAFAVFGDRANF